MVQYGAGNRACLIAAIMLSRDAQSAFVIRDNTAAIQYWYSQKAL